MKGIIFQLFEHVVVERAGADGWDDVLEASGSDGVYSSLGSYDDADFLSLVDGAATRLGTTVPDLIRAFGEAAIPLLADAHGHFFAGHTSTREFLLTLNDVIHAEVRKLYPDANAPMFAFDDQPDGAFALTYRSSRQMCTLAEGFVTGAAHRFGEQVAIEQPSCLLRGDDHCLLVCRFEPEP